MGDRANFVFTQTDGNSVVLYGHWAGHQMLANLANALETARPRWNDDAYGTRIIISQMVGEEWNQELGWGISVNTILDNEHSIPVVNFITQTVSLYDEKDIISYFAKEAPTPKFVMGFEAFVKKFAKSFAFS